MTLVRFRRGHHHCVYPDKSAEITSPADLSLKAADGATPGLVPLIAAHDRWPCIGRAPFAPCSAHGFTRVIDNARKRSKSIGKPSRCRQNDEYARCRRGSVSCIVGGGGGGGAATAIRMRYLLRMRSEGCRRFLANQPKKRISTTNTPYGATRCDFCWVKEHACFDPVLSHSCTPGHEARGHHRWAIAQAFGLA